MVDVFGLDQPARKPHSRLARIIDGLIALCAIVPYALVALVLRVLMGVVYFLIGQGMVEGPKYPLKDVDFAITLPMQLRAETLRMFEGKFATLAIPSEVAAWIVACGLFVLPILLVVGFGMRFAALGLVVITILFDRVLLPGSFWSLHVYWYALLLVLLSVGPGDISADGLIRFLYEKK